jgi:hypothetical protein
MRVQSHLSLVRVRPAGINFLLFGAILALTAGCGASSAVAVTPTVPAGNPTLAKCVHAWNHAVLGTGRRFVRPVAAVGENALMFVFRDRACGLAFSARTSQTAGTTGVFVTALDGDYQLDADPLSGPGSTAAQGSRSIQRRASRSTNVRVDPSTGRVVATVPSEHIATVPFTLIDTKTSCPAVIAEPSTDFWKVVSRNVSCVWTRTLVWAWIDREGTVTKTGGSDTLVRQILGWRCVGSDRQPLGPGGPVVYTRVSCRAGMRTVVVSTG